MSEVVIIGGGAIGLSLAYELADRGAQVTILERGALGQEASWAGAGTLPPGSLERARDARDLLQAHSDRLWPQWSQQLREETGIDNGYVRCGGLELTLREEHVPDLQEAARSWGEQGIRTEELSASEARRLEPALCREVRLAYRLPDAAQVRNPRHVKALIVGCQRRGVRLRTGLLVTGFERQGGRVTGVRTLEGAIAADAFVVASGAWSAALLAEAGVNLRVKPIRGQIALVAAPAPPFRHILLQGPYWEHAPSGNGRRIRSAGQCGGETCYMVARPDGRVLIGSTEEDVGFDTRPTPQGVHGLLDFAFRLVPGLRECHFERAWAGLRPGSADGLPYIGRAPAYDNLYIAAGHFRAGLQLSTGTALVTAQLILGEPTAIALDAFRPDRD